MGNASICEPMERPLETVVRHADAEPGAVLWQFRADRQAFASAPAADCSLQYSPVGATSNLGLAGPLQMRFAMNGTSPCGRFSVPMTTYCQSGA